MRTTVLKIKSSVQYITICAVMLVASGPAVLRAVIPQMNRAPSLILISVDTLRADRLSCYGYHGHETPHIDRIATGGTLFSAISSQVPLTLPSHTCLLTSTYPFSNGVEDNGEEVPPNTLTLASVLKSRGYRTAAFIGGFVLDRRFGLNQGFDLYDGTFNLHQLRGSDPGDIKRRGRDVVLSAIQWLNNNPKRPFFVFLHLYDLHTPYNLSPSERTRYGDGYEAELHYVDQTVGRFWDYLAQQHLLEKALVVFTADHGESLGQHGESTHGYFIYQSTIWVPLVIHWPAKTSTSYPARVDAPAGLVDVAPTILQYLGIPQPAQFQGESLLGYLDKKPHQEDREVYSESLYSRDNFGCTGLHSLRLGRYKYIDAPKPELYNLANDPHETHNIYSQEHALAISYREHLLSLMSRFELKRRASTQVPNPETVELLKSLGYMSGSSPRADTVTSRIDPKDRIAAYEKYGRASELAKKGQLEQSNVLLEKILDGDPNLTSPRLSLGWNFQVLGEQAEAAHEFKEVLREDSANSVAHFDLGVSYFKLGQIDNAIEELRATLALAPDNTRAENLLGTIWLQKRNYEEAEKHFYHVLEVDPDDYMANYDLGALDILKQQWNEAHQHLGVALRVEPNNPEAHNVMGSYYLRQENLALAREEFIRAIQLRPEFAEAHYNLAIVLRQQNQLEQAASELRRVLTIDPNSPAARDALDSLQQLLHK